MANVLLLAASALALAGCSGEESNQPPQAPPVRVEATGIVADGTSTGQQTIVGKGSGLTRMTQTGIDGKYSLSVTDLSPPFLFSNSTSPTGDPGLVFMTAPATRVGVINVTPLTTLLTAQLFGVDPINAYTNFGGGTDLSAQVTDVAIQQAQAEVTQHLQDVLGVQVKSGSSSFVETAFSATAGDAMYDTIQALRAKLTADGTTLRDLAARIAFGVRACRTESIQVTIDGVRKAFCPVIKGAVPQETDITIIDYVFKNIANDTLGVRVQGDTVLSAEYTTVGGRAFQCSGADCGLISLGAPAGDLSRTLTFASTTLTGAGGSALLDGEFVGPTPSITLPLLPCTDDRYFVIYENHDVVAECVDTFNPVPIAATFGSAVGPKRDLYRFVNASSSSPFNPHLEVVLENGASGPTVVSVYYTDDDPDTGLLRNRFLCLRSACNGVTIGAATVNNSAGFPVEIRNLTLDNSVLTGLNDDGTATGTSVTTRGSFTIARFVGADAVYPADVPCDPSFDTIAVEAFEANFNFCLGPNDGSGYRTVMDLGDGRVQIMLNNDMFSDTISIIFDDTTGAILETLVQISSSAEQFRCTTDCTGVAVSAPNGSGERTLTFTDAVIRHEESYPLPGDRTLKLNSPAMAMPPP